MSDPSNWPLSESALRMTVPAELLAALRRHPLSSACYITAIGFYPHARLHEMQRKDHDDYILMYCAEGKGNLLYEQQAFQIKMGDVFILPPKHAHAYQADSEQPWTLYWCHFQGKEASAFFDYIYQDLTVKLIAQMNEIDFLYWFKELVETARESIALENLIYASNLLRQILTRIERQNRLDKQSRQREKHSVSAALPKIQAFMRAHLNKQLNLEELAQLCTCSKFHFSRQYQQLTGKSPLRHFNELKMEHACFLLEQTAFSVSEIAQQLGYDDALYFSRVFRKVYQQAPSAYRKSLLVVP
jgi:AraC-like DNA-binding protein